MEKHLKKIQSINDNVNISYHQLYFVNLLKQDKENKKGKNKQALPSSSSSTVNLCSNEDDWYGIYSTINLADDSAQIIITKINNLSLFTVAIFVFFFYFFAKNGKPFTVEIVSVWYLNCRNSTFYLSFLVRRHPLFSLREF